jgi:hypothetical protein
MVTWNRWSSSKPASVANLSAAASTSPTLSIVELKRKLSRPFFGSLNGFEFRLLRNG